LKAPLSVDDDEEEDSQDDDEQDDEVVDVDDNDGFVLAFRSEFSAG
jgi:hypothetical protein